MSDQELELPVDIAGSVCIMDDLIRHEVAVGIRGEPDSEGVEVQDLALARKKLREMGLDW